MFGNHRKSAVEAYKMRTRIPVVFSSRAASDSYLAVQAFVNCFLFLVMKNCCGGH